ncbi:hypothetical protein S245_036444 [Arachis hypogaea]
MNLNLKEPSQNNTSICSARHASLMQQFHFIIFLLISLLAKQLSLLSLYEYSKLYLLQYISISSTWIFKFFGELLLLIIPLIASLMSTLKLCTCCYWVILLIKDSHIPQFEVS